MPGPDRRHAAGVARGAAALLGFDPDLEGTHTSCADGSRPPRAVMASALLHDVGKVESGLGTFSRVAVTAAALVMGRERLVARRSGNGRPSGTRAPGWRTRYRDYLVHDRIGARLLREAGSDEMTVAWAAEHHLAPSRWTVAHGVAAALKAADGD
ncbi:MAG: hypothetical protein JO337_10250 [Acidimicrobiales bacterium]|nr:hypothetical protein [Acidimicrobiales bacterium]